MAGYEGASSLTSPVSSVVFEVRCSQTRPGEAVFVVGGHEALGAWKTTMALPLQTSAELFPKWQTVKPVPLPVGYNVEYKFVVQKENREGQVQWQNFQGNYRVCPVADEVLLATSDWEKASAEVSSLGPASSATLKEPEKTEEKDRAVQKQEKEEILLKMAESGVDKAAAEVTSTCPLAVTLENREMRRRNFSQSLMALDASEPQAPASATPGVENEAKDTKDNVDGSEVKAETSQTEATSLEAPQPAQEPQEVPQTPQETAQETAQESEEPAKEPPEPDVVITQTPLEEETEELLRVPEEPETRGVSLKHITPLVKLESESSQSFCANMCS